LLQLYPSFALGVESRIDYSIQTSCEVRRILHARFNIIMLIIWCTDNTRGPVPPAKEKDYKSRVDSIHGVEGPMQGFGATIVYPSHTHQSTGRPGR
jgi:hypothetical protein